MCADTVVERKSWNSLELRGDTIIILTDCSSFSAENMQWGDYGKQEAVAELLHTSQVRHGADLDESVNDWQSEAWPVLDVSDYPVYEIRCLIGCRFSS